MVAVADTHPFLEARHVDNLVESVRLLARHVVHLSELVRDQTTAIKQNTQTYKDRNADAMRELAAAVVEQLGKATENRRARGPAARRVVRATPKAPRKVRKASR